jgi:hypothetical protein
MRIVFTGMFYPVFMGAYFLAALKRRRDVELFTVGPYTGDQIPWGGGMYCKHMYKPDVELPTSFLNSRPPIGLVEHRLPWKPDLWIQADAGFSFSGKPKDGKNFIIATDPHVLNYDPARADADKFFCMQKCYAKPGDEYLPYAYDPVWHSRMAVAEKKHDACLLGLHYPQRDRLVNGLRMAGKVVVYDLGPSYDDARLLYNQSRIGLNWSSLQDLNARAFELPAYGIPAVMNQVPDIGEFFEPDVDFAQFTTLQEAVEKSVYLLDHPEAAHAMAESGHKKVRKHTYDARIDQVLSFV